MSARFTEKTDRGVQKREARQRGCHYCALSKKPGRRSVEDYARAQATGQPLPTYVCPFARCPFRELDKLSDYEKFCDRLEKATGGLLETLIVVLRHKEE